MVWIALSLAFWLGWCWVAHAILRAKVREDDVVTGIAVGFMRLYARTIHRLRVQGAERAAAAGAFAGPVIMVSNHTSGLDPLLIQAAAPFEIRWMMAQDMRAPCLEEFLQYGRVIFVDREEGDPRSLREALRELRGGGRLGVFPEGFLERPVGTLMPFKPGAGLLALRTGALVLPVVIVGTPTTRSAWTSLFRPSRSVVRFLEPTRYERETWTAESVTADLRRRFADATGWPTSERRPLLTEQRRIVLDLEGRYVDEEGRVMPDEEVDALRERIQGAAPGTKGADP